MEFMNSVVSGERRVALLLVTLAWFMATVKLTGQELAAAAKRGDSVAGMKQCVAATFDSQDIISIESRCAVPVEIMWFYGDRNQGTGSLHPGEKVSTGVAARQIPQLGVLHYLACPSTHPVFHDSQGQYVTTPTDDYHCDEANPRVNNSVTPRVLVYNLLTSGDCVLEGGRLTLGAKGDGEWRARVRTNHTTNRDIWHISFEILDSDGRILFPVSPGDSPAMYGSPSTMIPWAVNFTFDPAKFRLIDHASVRTSC